MFSTFWTTFLTIFLAELGDKTQLATLLLAAKSSHRWLVFLGAALALITTSALGVLAGKLVGEHLPLNLVRYVSGALFILLGLLILWGK